MCNTRTSIIAALLISSLALLADDPGWEHPLSPYRAAFKIISQPNHPKCGYWLEVPACGTGDADGRDISVYDADGKRLPLLPIGPTRRNSVLVMCGGKLKNGDLVYAYWGSGRRDLRNNSTGLIPGLLVDIRSAKAGGDVSDWRASERMLRKSTLLGSVPVNHINLGENLIDTTDAFIMDFHGYMQTPKTRTETIFLVSDDAGYFFFGKRKQPILDQSGAHGAENRRAGQKAEVTLEPGLTKVRCVVIEVGGYQIAALGMVDGKRTKVVPPKAFVNAGQTEFVKAANKTKRKSSPAFLVRLLSYMQIEGHDYTAFELRSATGEKLHWKLGNGQLGHSAIFHQMAIGIDDIPVTTRSESGAKGIGRITFNELPRKTSWTNSKDHQFYTELMLAQSFDNLSKEYLDEYLYFFRLRERNPAAARIADYCLKAPAKATKKELFYYLVLAHNGATVLPDRTHNAFVWLFRHNHRFNKQRFAQEYLDFELYARRDPDAVKDALKHVKSAFEGDAEHKRCEVEVGLMIGATDQARALATELRETANKNYSSVNTALANNKLAQHLHYAETGYYRQAEKALREWIDLQPSRFFDGHYALVKAQYLARLGWYQGAYDLLTQFLKMEELPAFLPNIQMQRAELLVELGKQEDANAIFTSIVKQYPNHPVAAEAEKRLK